jgi:hypothetical protein
VTDPYDPTTDPRQDLAAGVSVPYTPIPRRVRPAGVAYPNEEVGEDFWTWLSETFCGGGE